MINYSFRSKASNASSPTTSVGSVVWSIRSPPATRLRSRQASDNVGAKSNSQISGRASADRLLKGKAKAKVEFKSGTETHQKKSARHFKSDDQRTTESDLTELEVLEESLRLGSSKQASLVQPSPRRLRSKDRQQASGETSTLSHPQRRLTATRRDQDAKNDLKSNKVNESKKTRVLPTRKTKYRDEDTKEEDAEDDLSEDVDVEESCSQDEEAEDEVEEDEEDEDTISKESSSEEEIDELASATSSPSTRRTPLRKRLRPRRKMGSAGPSDGDDEGDGGEVQSMVDDDMADARDDEEDAADMDDAETDTATERVDDEESIAVEPRKLRSGKVVGEEDVEMDDEEDIGEEDEDEEEEDEEDEDIIEAEEGEGEGGDEDAEGELDEEVMDEEGQFMYFNTHVPSLTFEWSVDLTIATAKTLVRLRRDDLVRLCETRDLEPVGTKPQLAQALLQWRDRQASECSSPSSTGTVRPPSTARRRRYHTRNKSSEAHTPILSRSHRVHLDEPRTPVPEKERSREKDKDKDEDLELDLESLGLEDREIPPDKLQKLEKIGSGGFKDVYIGKFKGRKIAIAEFRGQLSPSELLCQALSPDEIYMRPQWISRNSSC